MNNVKRPLVQIRINNNPAPVSNPRPLSVRRGALRSSVVALLKDLALLFFVLLVAIACVLILSIA